MKTLQEQMRIRLSEVDNWEFSVRIEKILLEHTDFIFSSGHYEDFTMSEFLYRLNEWTVSSSINTAIDESQKSLSAETYNKCLDKLLNFIGDANLQEQDMLLKMKDKYKKYSSKSKLGQTRTKEQLRTALRPIVKNKSVEIDNFINAL